MKEIIKSVLKQKRMKYLLAVVSLVVLTIIMNITFAAFSSRKTSELANIKIGKMNYLMKINSTETTKISALSDSITIAEISITSLNKTSSKYELIYEVCEGEICTKNIPEGMKIEYSSETKSPITGNINKDETKIIRVALINNTDSNITIKFSINAGYSHNELALLNHITKEYSEGDLVIAIKIDGEIASSMPPKSEANKYDIKVICTDGTGIWDANAWGILVTNINGVARCNVEFNKLNFGAKILAANPIKTGADFNVVANATNTATQSGLFSAPDDYGTSYYYRGVVNNNNVIFGGYQWKIIRIDGRGNIKLIYNGTEAQFNTSGTVNTTGANTQLPNTKFNTNYNDNKYVGYIVDGGSSTIKSAVDTFYAGLSLDAKAKIVDSIYCNDLTFVSGTGIGTNNTNYGAYDRLETKKTPTLICPESAGKLTLPIGLITADEVAYAGGKAWESNNAYYLYNASAYWTMSPLIFNGYYAYEWYVNSNGSLFSNFVDVSYGARPSITLSSETRITGTGSSTDPYKVV